jgi:hypothetical protein
MEYIQKQLFSFDNPVKQSSDNSGAIFSDDRKYRYALWRIWDESKPLVMFIGLNPSTANEETNDPTIRRVMSFAKSWGYGGVYMMNLFAYVTAYPLELKKCKDPIADNDKYLKEIASKCEKIVFAWGSFKEAIERSYKIYEMFPVASELGSNKDGSPKHPLYVKGDVQLIDIGFI